MLAAHDSMQSSRCRRVIRRALVCAGAMALASCSGGSLTADGGTGGGGFMTCDHPPRITSCSPDAGTLPVVSTTPFPEVPTAISPCSVEGASCEGTYCYDWGDRPFKTTCCAGRWRSDSRRHRGRFRPAIRLSARQTSAAQLVRPTARLRIRIGQRPARSRVSQSARPATAAASATRPRAAISGRREAPVPLTNATAGA